MVQTTDPKAGLKQVGVLRQRHAEEWALCSFVDPGNYESGFPRFLRHVKIEDANKGVISLKLWPHILETADLWQQGRDCIHGKGRQLGFSWLLAAYDIWRLIFFANSKILSISMGERYSRELLRKVKFIHKELPKYLAPNIKRQNMEELELEGVDSTMMALPSTEDAGRGFQASITQFDEFAFHPYASENYASARSTIADGGQMIIISTGNGPANTFADLWYDDDSGFEHRFTAWNSRPDRDQEWYDHERAAYVSKGRLMYFNRENPSSVDEMFGATSNLVYATFKEEEHVRPAGFDIRDARFRVAGVDPGGGDPCAIVVVGVHPEGRIHVFDEFYDRDLTTADRIRSYLHGQNSTAPFNAIWADQTEPTLIATLRSPASEFGIGLPVHPPVMYREKPQGISVVQSHLDAHSLTIDPRCVNLIREFKSYHWKTAREPGQDPWATKTPVDHHADALDALRYALTGLAKGFQVMPSAQPSYAGKIVPRTDPVKHDTLTPQTVKPQNTRPGPDFRPGRRSSAVRMGRR